MVSPRSPQRVEITHRDVSAVVKWFNATKGYGFVEIEGLPDAFLHVSVLQHTGKKDVLEGAKILCDLCKGPKGPQVASIRELDEAEATPRSSLGRSPGYGGYGGEMETIVGTVKFYNSEKQYGFVVPDQGGKDVFVSRRTLDQAKIQSLEPNQRVRLDIRKGEKGPMAERIELLQDAWEEGTS